MAVVGVVVTGVTVSVTRGGTITVGSITVVSVTVVGVVVGVADEVVVANTASITPQATRPPASSVARVFSRINRVAGDDGGEADPATATLDFGSHLSYP